MQIDDRWAVSAMQVRRTTHWRVGIMPIKKILLLACLALTTAAFAAPGLAQADPDWYYEGELVEEKIHKELHITGPVGLTIAGSIVKGEPCEMTLIGVAYNENAMADGLITNAETVNATCPTNLPGCSSTVTFENLPWRVTGVTELTKEQFGLEILETTFTLDFDANCQKLGVPAKISVAGAITPITCVPGCFNLEGHKDDLVTEPGGKLVDLTGNLKLEGPLTLE
jgi:hypothetical protein